jgi:hypothetical protein
MNQLTQSKNTTILSLLIALMLSCFGLSPAARSVLPAPDGGYPGQNTAEGDDPLFSLNAPASGIIWSFTGSLNIRRYDHTATLLPNGMVLVAGGVRSPGLLASAELYDPARGTWFATGSLNTGRYEHTATLLQNGNVLVAGGFGSSGTLASAEQSRRRRR